MYGISFPTAFFAGVISFFAPCVIPLLPAYIAYVTGVSLYELQNEGGAKFRKKVLVSSLFYILGFSLIFVVLGTAAAGLGSILRKNSILIQQVGGLLIIILGLNFAGFLDLPFLARERKIKLPKVFEHMGISRAFIVGIIFALAWTPCIGAVLGSILALAAATSTAIQGATLLFVYSLGISVPFLIVSLTLSSAPKYLKIISKRIGLLSKIAGIILALIGLLLLTNTYRFVNAWIFEIAFNLGYTIR